MHAVVVFYCDCDEQQLLCELVVLGNILLMHGCASVR